MPAAAEDEARNGAAVDDDDDDDGDDRLVRDATRDAVSRDGVGTTTPYDRGTPKHCVRSLSLSLSLSAPIRSAHVAQLIAAIYASERPAAAPVRTERSAVRIAPRTFTILVNTWVT